MKEKKLEIMIPLYQAVDDELVGFHRFGVCSYETTLKRIQALLQTAYDLCGDELSSPEIFQKDKDLAKRFLDDEDFWQGERIQGHTMVSLWK
jgi:hypothetical protein